MTTSQKGRIFISYRRADSAGYAGRIYDRLAAHFGEDAVFMDVDTIEAGVDFVEVLENAVQSCDVLVALIGRSWLNIKDETGKRRLDNPEDFVRIEIATALSRDIRVIPVLVDGAHMPHSTELPDNLMALARRNALQVNHHSFNSDARRLISQLELALKAAEDSKIIKKQALKEKQARAQREAKIERLMEQSDLAISPEDWKLANEKLNEAGVIEELEVGKTYTGRVTRLANFGAFVNINGVEGLVHLSELSWDRIQHPNEILEVGQEVKVKVINFDREKKRIGLSLRALNDDPWRQRVEKYRVGQLVEGVVTRLTKFGAFARLEGNIEGLIHISEISDTHIEHPKEVLKEGEIVVLRVIRIDPEQHRIGLSIRKVDSAAFADDDFRFLAQEIDRFKEEPNDEEPE